jgi:uncharacterized protein
VIFDYLDSSALVKLVVEEAESQALRAYLQNAGAIGGVLAMSSRLAHTEVIRTVSRQPVDRLARAREVLRGVHLIGVSEDILEQAAIISPSAVRTLDAIHLATALSEIRVLRHLVTYDSRLAQSAMEFGIPVVSPGVE